MAKSICDITLSCAYGYGTLNYKMEARENHLWREGLTHSEQRPQNIYSQKEINLCCIIKLATDISLQIIKTWCFV